MLSASLGVHLIQAFVQGVAIFISIITLLAIVAFTFAVFLGVYVSVTFLTLGGLILVISMPVIIIGIIIIVIPVVLT